MVWRVVVAVSVLVVAVVGLSSPAFAQQSEGRLITVYDRDTTRVFLTKEATIGQALAAQDIALDPRDTVEPSVNEELIASDYRVNIYRARPVIVEDGNVRIKTISPYQTGEHIARSVGITLRDGDGATLRPSSDFIGDGAGLVLRIHRASSITLELYGKKSTIRTLGKTVGDMLREKNIALGDDDRVSHPLDAPITAGMEVRVWREGVQIVSVDQEIGFAMQIIYDADRPLGYRVTQTPGQTGLRSVSYQVEVKDGVEVSRVQIADLITKQMVTQVDVIGLYNDGRGLTAAKGAQYFTDSKGVSHRETYYDLDMRRVMQQCGQGGRYTVRPDGVKVDAQGYVIIAANLANYPRCTIVETSLGPAKVYDTGGFALRHPHGFDIATDWTRADGI